MDMVVELTSDEMREAIRRIKGRRSNLEISKQTGISQAHIADILRGRREVSPKVAHAFGFERLTKYRKGPSSSKG